jgi:hypothetical protein
MTEQEKKPEPKDPFASFFDWMFDQLYPDRRGARERRLESHLAVEEAKKRPN